MIEIPLILIAILALVSIGPLIQWWKYKYLKKRKIVSVPIYSFSQELMDGSLESLKCERINNRVKASALKTRGSVRLSHNRILTERDIEEKKAEAYSVELP